MRGGGPPGWAPWGGPVGASAGALGAGAIGGGPLGGRRAGPVLATTLGCLAEALEAVGSGGAGGEAGAAVCCTEGGGGGGARIVSPSRSSSWPEWTMVGALNRSGEGGWKAGGMKPPKGSGLGRAMTVGPSMSLGSCTSGTISISAGGGSGGRLCWPLMARASEPAGSRVRLPETKLGSSLQAGGCSSPRSWPLSSKTVLPVSGSLGSCSGFIEARIGATTSRQKRRMLPSCISSAMLSSRSVSGPAGGRRSLS